MAPWLVPGRADAANAASARPIVSNERTAAAAAQVLSRVGDDRRQLEIAMGQRAAGDRPVLMLVVLIPGTVNGESGNPTEVTVGHQVDPESALCARQSANTRIAARKHIRWRLMWRNEFRALID